MAFDRKDYGMNSGIPFIKIADRVEVTSTSRRSESAGRHWSLSNSPARQKGSRRHTSNFG